MYGYIDRRNLTFFKDKKSQILIPSGDLIVCVCFITAGPITKLFAWGEEESGGHVL